MPGRWRRPATAPAGRSGRRCNACRRRETPGAVRRTRQRAARGGKHCHADRHRGAAPPRRASPRRARSRARRAQCRPGRMRCRRPAPAMPTRCGARSQHAGSRCVAPECRPSRAHAVLMSFLFADCCVPAGVEPLDADRAVHRPRSIGSPSTNMPPRNRSAGPSARWRSAHRPWSVPRTARSCRAGRARKPAFVLSHHLTGLSDAP